MGVPTRVSTNMKERSDPLQSIAPQSIGPLVWKEYPTPHSPCLKLGYNGKGVGISRHKFHNNSEYIVKVVYREIRPLHLLGSVFRLY